MRILRAAGGAAYRPSLADWGAAEECVERGWLQLCQVGGANGVSSVAYELTPAGRACLMED